MAKAFKCDICGKFYDQYHKLYLGKTKTSSARLIDVSSMYYDICPDCVAAIQETIDERRQNMKTDCI